MESSILGIASNVGTPLALAGASVAFLYLIYRVLLRGRLLTTLGSTHSFRIVNRVVTFVFILALAATVLGVSAFLVTHVVPAARPSDGLAVVDVEVIEDLPFPIVDLKFRNPGTQVAYIKAVEFDLTDREVTEYDLSFYAGPTSWQYDLLLEPKSEETIFRLPVSQIVPANGTDRFQIVVGQSSGYGEINYVDYRAKVKILYNEGLAIDSGQISFRVYSPPHFITLDEPIGLSTKDRLEALRSENLLRVREAAKILGATQNQQALSMLQAIFEQDPEKYIQFYRTKVLTLPYYSERGAEPEEALSGMYGAVFWAIRKLSGEIPEGLVGKVAKPYRNAALEGYNQAKRAFE